MKVFDRSQAKLLPLSGRENKITVKDIAQLSDPVPGYKNPDLEILAGKIISAKKNKKPVIWAMGAHSIRRGNSRFIIDLMEKGFITHIAANGAVAIHDFELAFQGATCEDVEFYIRDGRFGNWRETASFINDAAEYAYGNGLGFGKALGKMISQYRRRAFSYPELSVFAAAYRLKIPATIHKGIGYDITDQSRYADYAALGWASGRDFLIFTDSVSRLEGGGVFLNIGTQVMGPEVYLKALSMARNVAAQEGREIKNFATAVFDIVDLGDWGSGEGADYKKEENLTDSRYSFRPFKTILVRTVKDGGESFYIRGDFRTTIPNLYRLLTEGK